MAAVPTDFAEQLHRAFLENASNMLRFSAELLALSRLLNEHGVVMVPYKGPALAGDLYGNLALRQSVDLDLLVARRDVAKVRLLLIERRYRPRHTLSQGAQDFMLRGRYHEEFVHESGMSLELHWAFTNGDVKLPLDLNSLRPNLRTIKFGGGTMPMFGREDMLLILCIHGCKHRWDRLEWICGVAETLRASSIDLDWNGLQRRASSLGVLRMFLLGVLLAHDLLEAPVPARAVESARSDQAVARLAAHIPDRFLDAPTDEGGASTLTSDLFRFQLRERLRDRLHFAWYRLTTPSSPESWSGFSIGPLWLPMHAALRPFRILSKLAPAIRRHLLASRERS